MTPVMKRLLLALFVAVVTSGLWIPTPAVQAQAGEQVQVLVLLTDDDAQKLTQVRAFIDASGGRVLHTLPHQAIIARVSSDTLQTLAAMDRVAEVFTQAIEVSTAEHYGPGVRRFAGVWNHLITPQATDLDADLTSKEQNDAFIAPDLPSTNGMSTSGASVATSTPVTPTYYQTSEYMAGSVAVGIVLVESDGSVDPSTEDWTAGEKQRVFNEIVAALNWWAELEPRANLSFVYDDHFTTPLTTSVEPISRPYSDQQYWIADAMSALGYETPSYFTNVRDYDNDLRDTYQTDWAFTIFVVDSSADSDNSFSNGHFAYAYLGGPFMVMTYGNSGYGPNNMDAVAAHEIGHIFHALDQYYSAQQPCTKRSGYLDVENQNSKYGDCASDIYSIMRTPMVYSVDAIDPYAAGQIGWRDSDGDDILDPLDTGLPISTSIVSIDGNRIVVSGTTEIIPYLSPSRTSVTINTLTGVQYRFDEGDWRQATADDGLFDETAESYFFTDSLSPGLHTLEVAALDSAGNVSDVYATETIVILDPVDGGLNTEFFLSSGDVSSSEASAGEVLAISGIAYHLQEGIIVNVEYRVDGGSWQSIDAQDGTFDSDYEPFALAIDTHELDPGTHLVEGRATDAGGSTEVNVASQEIKVVRRFAIFLPLVMNEM